MEKMPYQPHVEERPLPVLPLADIVATDWRDGLPVLTGTLVTLRELEMRDAPSLFALLTSAEVTRFISPPPTSLEGFERFIAWSHQQRAARQYVCFAVVPKGTDTAVGIIQIRSLEPGFATAEAGCVIGSEFWGNGMFVEGALLVGDFAFGTIGAHRVEARAAVRNGRGNAALRKLGAVQEGVLRRSLLKDGDWLDQALWSFTEEEWRQAKAVWGEHTIH